MQGVTEEAVTADLFDQLPGIHHRHPVSHARHDAEVMGNQQDRHVGLLLQFLQQFQHLCLDGDIQCRGRLIRYQQVRFAGQCDGYHDALFHTAGKLVWIFRVAPFDIGDTDGIE